jgi:two-component system, LytTR family, response regulator
MNVIKVIVIEDEVEGMEQILRIIKNNLPEVEVIGTGRTNADLLRMIEEDDLEPDVLVLDIQLPDGQVFKSLDIIDTGKLQIIFTTAYNEYMQLAFDKAAIHYLLKPISKDAFLVAFGRVKNVQSGDDAKTQLGMARSLLDMGPNIADKVGIASVEGIRFVQYKDIVRMEGDDNYTTFFMIDGERIIASRNLGHYTEHYQKHNFIKTHQSHMVNYNHIRKYVRGDGGYLEMDNKETVPLARRYRGDFLTRIKALVDQLN